MAFSDFFFFHNSFFEMFTIGYKATLSSLVFTNEV